MLALLTGRKDLGIHTELLDPQGYSISTRAGYYGEIQGGCNGQDGHFLYYGDKALYDFPDGNEEFEQYPVDLMNNPYVIGREPGI